MTQHLHIWVYLCATIRKYHRDWHCGMTGKATTYNTGIPYGCWLECVTVSVFLLGFLSYLDNNWDTMRNLKSRELSETEDICILCEKNSTHTSISCPVTLNLRKTSFKLINVKHLGNIEIPKFFERIQPLDLHPYITVLFFQASAICYKIHTMTTYPLSHLNQGTL